MSFGIRVLVIATFYLNFTQSFAQTDCDKDLLSTVEQSQLIDPDLNDATTIPVDVDELVQNLEKNCSPQACDQEAVTKSLFSSLKNRNVKAYAAISSVMIGSSSLVAYLSTLVSKDHPALSYFVATFLSQITSLGVYVVGAPIWEPLQSKIRAFAYRMTGTYQDNLPTHNFLERQYFKTNKALSLNEQMSRNVIKDYIKTLTQTLYFAKRASVENDYDYITSQLAEIAVRLRFLYPDVNPTNKIVVNAVHAGFTDFIVAPESYVARTLAKIKELDPVNDYGKTIEAWLVK